MCMWTIAALMLISTSPTAQDPFDQKNNPLAVDDKVSTGEPSFTDVAICIGSDKSGGQILLLDRICLNREAAEILAANVSELQQEVDVSQAEVKANAEGWREAESSRNNWEAFSSIFSVVVLIIAFAMWRSN